jgi:helicase
LLLLKLYIVLKLTKLKGQELQEKIKMEQLEYFGIPDYIVDIWKKHYSDTLLPVQEKAIRQFDILQHNHKQALTTQYNNTSANLLVISPSSSGKTLVGEIAALKEIIFRKKVIFLVPLRVLAEEKYKHFCQLYYSIGLKVKMSSSDHRYDDYDIIHGNFHIAVIVYEKFYYLQLQYPNFLNNVSLVIADEIQLINDPQRGPFLENNLNYLRNKHPRIHIIALSAFTENAHHLGIWLNASVLFSSYRPIELRKGIIRNGIYKYLEHNTGITGKEIFFKKNEVQECNLASYLNATLKYLLGSNESSLIFFPTKREARIWSRWLASQFHLPAAGNTINKLTTVEDSTSRDELLFLLQNSIAYHCTDLSRIERQLIEEGIRMGEVKITCATETLAMGINLPVNNVILTGQKIISKRDYKSLERGYHKRALSLSEVENMGGRAGRLSKQSGFGRIIFLAPSLIELSAYQHLYFNLPTQAANSTTNYSYPAIQAQSLQVQESSPGTAIITASIPVNFTIPEEKPIKIEHDLLTFFLHCIAQGHNSIDDIYNIDRQNGEITDKHFWNHKSYEKINKTKITEILEQLENYNLIKKYPDESYYLTHMGSLLIARGITFDTYIHFQKWLSRFNKNDISELEVLFLLATSNDGRDFCIPFPINERTKSKKTVFRKWKEYLRMRMLGLIFELGEDHKPIFRINLDKYEDNESNIDSKINLEKYLAIKKTLLMFDWISEKDSREIEENYGILYGNIQKIGEGFSWLADTLAAIASEMGWQEQRATDLNRIKQLSERLISGIEEKGLLLAKLQIPDLTRTYIQKLVQEGYNDKQCLLEIEPERLKFLLPEYLIDKIKKYLLPDTNDKSDKLITESLLNKQSINTDKIKNISGRSTANKIKQFTPVLEINKNRPDRIFFFQKEIPVKSITFQLIVLLAENQGKMLSYDEIINKLWPDDEDATYHRLWYHLGKLRNGMQNIIKNRNISDSPEKYVTEKILKVFPGRGLLLNENILVKTEK